MRFTVFGSKTCRCRDGSLCSEACDWDILEANLASRTQAERVGLYAVIVAPGRPGAYARARVFTLGPVVGRLVADYRRDDPA